MIDNLEVGTWTEAGLPDELTSVVAAKRVTGNLPELL
jgi:hypothetical protein